jgi:gamma-glutamylputrescine oxidase
LPRLFSIGLGVDWGTVYWRQAPDGVIVLGGYRNHDPLAETSDRAWVNPRIQEALSHFLPDTFPDFPPFHVNQRWAGIMDYPVDGQPVIGAMPHLPNQWIIAGFGGHGLPVALGASKAVAEAIVTGRTPAVLEPFDPGRFSN